MISPVAPQSLATPIDRLGHHRRRAAGRAGVTRPQPARRDHRRRLPGADHGNQRVQAAQQHVVPADLGMAERHPLLLPAVHAPQHRVDVHKAQLIRAGQQRGASGQPDQHLPGGGLQLQRMPMGEGAGTSPTWTPCSARSAA